MGTSNFAGHLTAPDALSFHASVGASRKEARLRYLRDYWVERVREIRQLEILTPDDPSLHAGLTSFRFKGKGSTNDIQSLQRTLVSKYRILTAARKGIARGDAIRVTPALYTAEADLDRLVAALREIGAKG
jgi:isopenicillin-N epimerase